MTSLRPSRPSAGLVVSIIALVVALGGTSYAAFTLPKNSVGAKQLRNGAVTAAKIAPGSIDGSRINVGSLGPVPSAINATHATNANNAQTAANATNATTAANAINAGHAQNADTADNAATAGALAGVRYVVSAPVTNPPGAQSFGSVVCPAGLAVVGGGEFGSGSLDQSVNGSYPETASGTVPNTWNVWINNTSGTATHNFKVYAICVPESGAASTF